MQNLNLQYDRETVNLVFALKRSLPLDDQADFKLSSPDLIEKIKLIHHRSKKASIKALAGQVLAKLGEPTSEPSNGLFSIFKTNEQPERTYRGANTLSRASEARKSKKVKMYRGQVVD